MSLDGFIAGPNQSVETPLGAGGERLHEWVVSLAAWRSAHGLTGGVVNESTAVLDETMQNLGATIMGRNMFGGHPGPWSAENPWTGWWGGNPPFHHPVFVVTHYARPPLVLEDTTFHFVTDGIHTALAMAREAARGRDIALGGGAKAAQQYLNADLIDEMEINLVPILLSSGERLFDSITNMHGLELTRTVATPAVTHLKFERR